MINIRNIRNQEINRIKNAIQNQIRSIQTFDNAGPPVNGYRSLAFYQAGRNTGGIGNKIIVGNHTGNGTTVS